MVGLRTQDFHGERVGVLAELTLAGRSFLESAVAAEEVCLRERVDLCTALVATKTTVRSGTVDYLVTSERFSSETYAAVRL